MFEYGPSQVQDEGINLSGNFSTAKAEKLQDLVNTLVNNYQQVNREKKGRRLKFGLASRDLMGYDLPHYKSWLAEAHRIFIKSSQQKMPLTYTSEWVLDNYYIIRQSLQQIKEDLPISFYRQLPKLTGDSLNGYPRVYALARTILAYQNLLLEPVDLQTILVKFQEKVPLAMGELWALPIFLRYSLIEAMAHLLVSTVRPTKPPDLPKAYTLPLEVGNILRPGDSTETD